MGRPRERILTDGAVTDGISVGRVEKSTTSAASGRLVDVAAGAALPNEDAAAAAQSRRTLALFNKFLFLHSHRF